MSPVVGHGTVLVVVDKIAGGEAMLGTVGTGPPVNTGGDTLIVGTAAAELTPRLPISVDPSGIPVRAAPPGVMGDVGVDDEALQQCLAAGLLDEIHIDLVPVVLGGGIRLFEDGRAPFHLEITAASGTPTVTHLTYRVVRGR